MRELVHASVPGLEETIKWRMPHFTIGGKNLAGMAAFKHHAAFIVHGDGRQGDGQHSDAMGQYGKITALADLPADEELTAKLRAAAALIAAGTKGGARARPAPVRAELPVPDDFAALLSPAARAILDGFAPSHRREYLEWIAAAKRPETRARRMADAATWIAAGKKRNWKYEKC